MKLTLTPISAEAFAPFGTLHALPVEGARERLDPAMTNHRPEAPLRINLTRKTPSPLPVTFPALERHPFSTQTFVPIDCGRWLVVVTPKTTDGGPDMAGARAFLMEPDQGVTYAVDVWHAPLVAFDKPSCFLISIWRDGSAEDEIFADLPEPLEIGE